MENVLIKPYDVIINKDLPEIFLEKLPADGDPLEIDGQLYFVCENSALVGNGESINVIPLIVRDPSNIKDINRYINCLSRAHRKVMFRNKQGVCDLENCEEMVIS